MTAKPASLLPLLALLSSLGACSDEVATFNGSAQDSGTPTDTSTVNDVPPADAGRDVPASSDAPATDGGARDVPASGDVPSATDVPGTDVPPAIDVPAATDVPPATDAPPAGDACTRPSIERAPERLDCRPSTGTTCPSGYECLSHSGIVLQQYCGRACVTDCDCAAGDRCGSYSDKRGTHPVCVGASSDAL